MCSDTQRQESSLPTDFHWKFITGGTSERKRGTLRNHTSKQENNEPKGVWVCLCLHVCFVTNIPGSLFLMSIWEYWTFLSNLGKTIYMRSFGHWNVSWSDVYYFQEKAIKGQLHNVHALCPCSCDQGDHVFQNLASQKVVWGSAA